MILSAPKVHPISVELVKSAFKITYDPRAHSENLS